MRRRRIRTKGTKSYRYYKRKGKGQYAKNPKKRRRATKRRKSSSRSYRRNPAVAMSVRSLKSSVTSMFDKKLLTYVGKVALGGAVVAMGDSYLSQLLDSKLQVRGRIAQYTGAYADKAIYVYDRAFTLAATGVIAYGSALVLKMLGVKESTRRSVRDSLVYGGAMVVGFKVAKDVIGYAANMAGLALPMGDYAEVGDMRRALESDLGDYMTIDQPGQAQVLSDYATVDDTVGETQLNGWPYEADLSGTDFEDDMSEVARMGDGYPIEENF